MKIMELNIKEYEKLVKKGLAEEEKKIPTLNDIRENYGLPRIEEKKIPEKLEEYDFERGNQRELAEKINEIIDYLKSKGE